MAAGVSGDLLPEVSIKDEYTPSLYNDPALSDDLRAVFAAEFGEARVVERRPEMIGEDFARYGRTADRIPICMFRVGVAKQRDDGVEVQSLHSPTFSPVAEPAIKTAVRALTAAALDLLHLKD
jgi:hippurate hydrolase